MTYLLFDSITIFYFKSIVLFLQSQYSYSSLSKGQNYLPTPLFHILRELEEVKGSTKALNKEPGQQQIAWVVHHGFYSLWRTFLHHEKGWGIFFFFTRSSHGMEIRNSLGEPARQMLTSCLRGCTTSHIT